MAPTSNSITNSTKTIKFLYSYGGRIVPRPTDGVLRYAGGYTRVLSIDRSVTFSELMVKFGESCGPSMDLKCKQPTEDLDVLISIKSEEDLRNVIEVYDTASPEAKIRAVLFPIKSAKRASPPSSPMSCFDFPSPTKPQKDTVSAAVCCYTTPPSAAYYCCSPAIGYPVNAGKYYEGRSPRHLHHAPHRSHSRSQ